MRPIRGILTACQPTPMPVYGSSAPKPSLPQTEIEEPLSDLRAAIHEHATVAKVSLEMQATAIQLIASLSKKLVTTHRCRENRSTTVRKVPFLPTVSRILAR